MSEATTSAGAPLKHLGIASSLGSLSGGKSFWTGLGALFVSRSGSRPKMSDAEAKTEAQKITKTEEEWKDSLSAMEYAVIRGKGTEPAGSGEYDKFYPKPGDGYFACRACGNPLYSAAAKFNSGCGWPAFDKCYTDSVNTNVDNTLGMRRIEIVCAKCDGHLGHVFEGEGFTKTNERHCVNSISIRYVKEALAEETSEEAVTSKF